MNLFQSPLADNADVASVGRLAPALVETVQATPGPASDVYGLGVILYELLTGRPPFTAATMSEMIERVQSADPFPPSRVNSHVTPELDAF